MKNENISQAGRDKKKIQMLLNRNTFINISQPDMCCDNHCLCRYRLSKQGPINEKMVLHLDLQDFLQDLQDFCSVFNWTPYLTIDQNLM